MLSNIEKQIIFAPERCLQSAGYKVDELLICYNFEMSSGTFSKPGKITYFKHAIGANDQYQVMAPDFENSSICDYLFSSDEIIFFFRIFLTCIFCTCKCIRRFYVFDLLKCCE